ncbi:MAG: hypothetical protein AMXMBFR34_08460 [Myxococcaceae bacterium]
MESLTISCGSKDTFLDGAKSSSSYGPGWVTVQVKSSPDSDETSSWQRRRTSVNCSGQDADNRLAPSARVLPGNRGALQGPEESARTESQRSCTLARPRMRQAKPSVLRASLSRA